MQGQDVVELQRAIRARLKARGLADDIPVATHGKFTEATALAAIEAQYFLGLRKDTYLRVDAKGHRVLTEGAQRVIREPESRTPDQLQRAKDRKAQLERGPRYYEELARSSAPAAASRTRWGSRPRRSASRSARRARTPARRSTTGSTPPATRARCRGAAAS